MFPCDQCGECCRNVDKSPLYADLDSGNGTCRYLEGNLCGIYEERPLLCRIDECYELYYKDLMTLEEYYRKNRVACDRLKKQSKVKQNQGG